MAENNQQTRAVALLAGNGAALAMCMQFVIDEFLEMTPPLATGLFVFLCFTFAGVVLSYRALRCVGRPNFATLELWAALLFGVHIVSLGFVLAGISTGAITK